MKLATLLLMCGCACAQQGRPSGVVDTAIANVANLPAQKISANDLIAVSVYDSPELARTIRVSADGTIRFPMLKQRLHAAGLTPADLEAAIAEGLKKDEILVDPIVTVTVVEYDSRPITVAGAVRRPTKIQAVGKVTLLDALAKADGLSAEAGPEILLSRAQPASGGGPSVIERISVKKLIDNADASMNVVLAGGDEIRVPEAGKVYVVGNVRRPGTFPIRDERGTTLLRLLAMAEGLAPFAAKTAYLYRGSTLLKNEIPVELDKILQRKAEDIVLQPEDVLYIPDAKGRRAAISILDRATGFGAATASGVLIWHR